MGRGGLVPKRDCCPQQGMKPGRPPKQMGLTQQPGWGKEQAACAPTQGPGLQRDGWWRRA